MEDYEKSGQADLDNYVTTLHSDMDAQGLKITAEFHDLAMAASRRLNQYWGIIYPNYRTNVNDADESRLNAVLSYGNGGEDGGRQTVNLVIGNTDYGNVPAQVSYHSPHEFDGSSFTIPGKSEITGAVEAWQNQAKLNAGTGSGNFALFNSGAGNGDNIINNGSVLRDNGFLSGQAKVVRLSSEDNTTYWVKAPEYTSAIYNGKVYNIYVPWSGSDINSGEWQTVGVYNTTFKDFSWSQFAYGFAAADPKVKPIIEGGDNIIYNMPNTIGVAKLSGLSLCWRWVNLPQNHGRKFRFK